ncbi:MAG: hypothetical protein MJ002_06620 [Paludibacteraceae bacterium]|nr:hypothetical protein [Paludibacteraceae bacterium]
MDRFHNEYLNHSTELIIEDKADSIDFRKISLVNEIYTNNNDSFNACASNMVLGVIYYHKSETDSALICLLNAERFSDSRPELKPHIYYYLASAFTDYDPLLARDIILSHQKERIDKYDYTKILDIDVSRQVTNMHNLNSIYYSRIIQQGLETQASQHRKEIHLYRCIIFFGFIFSILVLLSYLFVRRFRRKNAVLTSSMANQRTNFDTLLNKYMDLYRTKCDKDSVFGDANEILSALHNEYADLTKSDIAIIWLILLSFDKKEICSILNINSDYYYQRRTKIRKTLNFNSTRELNDDLKRFVPKYLSEYSSQQN